MFVVYTMGCMEELSYLWRFPRGLLGGVQSIYFRTGVTVIMARFARGAAERDAVVVPAGGEQGCADIGAIDEMLPWCQVFRAQSLVDGVGLLGLTELQRWSCARA